MVRTSRRFGASITTKNSVIAEHVADVEHTMLRPCLSSAQRAAAMARSPASSRRQVSHAGPMAAATVARAGRRRRAGSRPMVDVAAAVVEGRQVVGAELHDHVDAGDRVLGDADVDRAEDVAQRRRRVDELLVGHLDHGGRVGVVAGTAVDRQARCSPSASSVLRRRVGDVEAGHAGRQLVVGVVAQHLEVRTRVGRGQPPGRDVSETPSPRSARSSTTASTPRGFGRRS